jgi:RmlD substrate binding domain
MSLPTAWITGAGGLIGHHVVQAASRFAPTWRVRPITREIVDLCDFAAVERLFREESPILIIHCAARRSGECSGHSPPLRSWSEDSICLFFLGPCVRRGEGRLCRVGRREPPECLRGNQGACGSRGASQSASHRGANFPQCWSVTHRQSQFHRGHAPGVGTRTNA